jgi:hypothetical protein
MFGARRDRSAERAARTGNEFGDFLPDADDGLQQESHFVHAYDRKKAKKKCQDIAAEYNGVDADVDHVDEGRWDCRFWRWGK